MLFLPRNYPSVCLFALLLCVCFPRGAPCGGVLRNTTGVIATPNFPGKFPLPARCQWTIENRDPSGVIVLYFTQLYVTSGFSVTDFTILIEPWSDPTLLFESNEKSALETQWISTPKPYMVIDFELASHYGTHIRALDNLLDVYGFNITYEIVTSKPDASRGEPSETSEEEGVPAGVRAELCSVVDCSLSGHCYANANFTAFECACFDGFSGPNCGDGPLCQRGQNVCENGARCRHAGATHILCVCPEGYSGVRCEIPASRSPNTDCVSDADSSCSDTGVLKQICPYVKDADAAPCSCDASQAISVDYEKARYEVRLALDVTDSNRTALTALLNRTVTKLFRGISKIEKLDVVNVTLHEDVRFHFVGAKAEKEKYHMTLLKLLNRPTIGSYPLRNKIMDFNQEAMLQNKEFLSNQKNNRVREGKEFILSCIAEGSRFLQFKWYKDNALIDVKNSMREMWTKTSGPDSRGQVSSILAVQSAHKLDQGRFTCQVIDLEYQQCQTLDLEVMSAPEVKISPLTATIEKGSNLTIKCMSPDEHNFGNTSEKFGYSWIKDGDLFPSDPNTEIWEDLEPGGSVLRVINIQKAVTYACLVTAPNVPPSTSTSRLNIIEPTRDTPLCPASTSYGLAWPTTLNGEMAFVESLAGRCTVSRVCTLESTMDHVAPAVWEVEDFSSCIPPSLYTIETNFHSLRLGYETTSINLTLHDTADYMASGPQRYPGQVETTVTLLNDILRFIQHTTRSSLQSLVNASEYFYAIVNYLLHWDQPLPSFVHRQKVYELQAIIEVWSLLWCNHLSGDHKRLLFNSLIIDVRKLYNLTSQYITVQQPSTQFKNNPSSWSPNTSVSFESSSTTHASKGVLNLVIIAYANLSQYLPPRFLNKKSDLLYEVASSVVSTSLGDNGMKMAAIQDDRIAAKKQQQHLVKKLRVVTQFTRPNNDSIQQGWNVTCGVSVNGGESWLLSCGTQLELDTVTCTCSQTGLHALLITLDKNQIALIVTQESPLYVLVGYSSCVLEVAFTLLHILPRWFRHKFWFCRRSWFLFLKVKFCLFIMLVMLLMTYLALQNSLSKTRLSAFLLLAQYLMLIALSCHLTGVLFIYSEVVHYLAYPKNPRVSILFTLHSLSLLIILCLSLSIVYSQLVIYLCYASTLVYVLAFACLYHYVRTLLRDLSYVARNKFVLSELNFRQGYLEKSGLLVLSLSLCYISAILHLSLPSSLTFHYLLAVTAFGLGLTIILVYCVHKEPEEIEKPRVERSSNDPEQVDADMCEAFDLVLGAPQGRNGGGILRDRREEEGEGFPLTESSGSGGNKMVTFSHDLVKDSEPSETSPSLSPSSGCERLDILPPCIQQTSFGQQSSTTHISIEQQPLNASLQNSLRDNGPQRLLCSAVVESDMADDSSFQTSQCSIVPNQSKMISFSITSVPPVLNSVPSVLNSLRVPYFSSSHSIPSSQLPCDQNPVNVELIPSQIPFDYPVAMSTVLESDGCRTPGPNSHAESHRKTLDLSTKPLSGFSSFKMNSSQLNQIAKVNSQFSQTLGRDHMGSRTNSQELSNVKQALDFRENADQRVSINRLESSTKNDFNNVPIEWDRKFNQPNSSNNPNTVIVSHLGQSSNIDHGQSNRSQSYCVGQANSFNNSHPLSSKMSHNNELNNPTSKQFVENQTNFMQSALCHANTRSSQSNRKSQSCDELANSILVSSEALDQISRNAAVSNLIVDGLRVDEINRPDSNSTELIESFAESTTTDSSDSAIADVDSNPNLSGPDSSDNSGNVRASDDSRVNPSGFLITSDFKAGYKGDVTGSVESSTGPRSCLEKPNTNSISMSDVKGMSLTNQKETPKDPNGCEVNSEGELLSQISQDLEYLLNGPTEDFSSLKRRKKGSPSCLSSPRLMVRKDKISTEAKSIDSETVVDEGL